MPPRHENLLRENPGGRTANGRIARDAAPDRLRIGPAARPVESRGHRVLHRHIRRFRTCGNARRLPGSDHARDRCLLGFITLVDYPEHERISPWRPSITRNPRVCKPGIGPSHRHFWHHCAGASEDVRHNCLPFTISNESPDACGRGGTNAILGWM